MPLNGSGPLLLVVLALTVVSGCATTRAQSARPGSRRHRSSPLPTPTGAPPEGRVPAEGDRACEACPVRRAGRVLIQTTGINVLYVLANLGRGRSPRESRREPVDEHAERLGVGLGRFSGQPDRTSLPGQQLLHRGAVEWAELLRIGSCHGVWQRHVGYFGETNRPSLTTSLTPHSVALRSARCSTGTRLVRDTRSTGRRRMWREISRGCDRPHHGLNRC